MTSRDTASLAHPKHVLPRRSPTRWIPRVILWSLAAIVAVVLGGAVALFQAYESEYILPGVAGLGVGLGHMTRAQAAATLQQAWEEQRIAVMAGDVTSYHSPADLGLFLDADAMTHSAYGLSRTVESLTDVLRKEPAQPIPASWRVDLAQARALLMGLAQDVHRPAVDATLTFADGHIDTTPSETGQTVDLSGSLDWLRQHGDQVMEEGQWVVQMASLTPKITEVDRAAATARELLDHSVQLDLYDAIEDKHWTWSIASETWSDWLSLSLDEGDPTTIVWELDEEKAAEGLREELAEHYPGRYLATEEVLAAIRQAVNGGADAARLRLYHLDSRYTIQKGETLSSIAFDTGIPYPWIQQANPGLGTSVYAGQVITIPSPDVLLPLPVVESQRITMSLTAQTVWVYEEGELLWEWPCSTGLPSSPTAPGVFQVQSHELNAYAANWDLWMPNFVGIYQPVPDSDFMNGFHGFPSRGGDQFLWMNNLGQPITFGCIMLSSDNAKLLYDWAQEGAIVEIHP